MKVFPDSFALFDLTRMPLFLEHEANLFFCFCFFFEFDFLGATASSPVILQNIILRYLESIL